MLKRIAVLLELTLRFDVLALIDEAIICYADGIRGRSDFMVELLKLSPKIGREPQQFRVLRLKRLFDMGRFCNVHI